MNAESVSALARSHPVVNRGNGFRLVELPCPGSLDCWISVPDHVDESAPTLVSVHGIHRNAYAQASRFASGAAERGRVVVAPLFDSMQFKGYQQVLLKNRTDIALFGLLERLRLIGIPVTRKFDLFGYSGGAQFAHRLAMFYPQRISMITLAAAGWYTFPDESPYPYGLGPRKRPSTALDSLGLCNISAFLQLPIRVYAGKLDNRPDDHTRRNPQLDSLQGTNRLDRARAWVDALRQAAARLELGCDVTLHEIDDCRHHFSDYLDKSDLTDQVMSTTPTTT